ncbi:MAG: hypothetical protein ACFFAN_04690 [Promethearchaeota archaeon]
MSKNKYENKSKLIRDALLRLMSTIDASESSGIETSYGILPVSKKIIGNMIVIAPNDFTILKKLNKIESNYKEQIVSKNQHFYKKNLFSIFIVFEGSLQEYQNIVVEINSIKEIKNFRYLIIP